MLDAVDGTSPEDSENYKSALALSRALIKQLAEAVEKASKNGKKV